MGMANIDALLADIAKKKESLRIAQQSLANIDPKYKMNEAYIAKLKDQVAQLQQQISTDTATLQQSGNSTPINPTRANITENAYTNSTKTIQTPYDDEGNLNPGYKINDETGQPYYAGTDASVVPQQQISTTVQVFDDGSKLETFSDGATLATDAEGNQTFASGGEQPNPNVPNQPVGTVASSVNAVRPQATVAVARNSFSKSDWRLRLSLAAGSNYLYGAATQGQILFPLKQTDGVIFPYSPSIQTAYRANYDGMDITHSNYKMYFYKNSNVDEIQLTADFTAQDTTEANYLLAVIHFFKSVTKMFYGQDGLNGPKAGTPPPLCYLNGYGQYQFNNHPVLLSTFSYSLPNDVDYIRAGPNTTIAGQARPPTQATSPKQEGLDFMKWLRKSANQLLGGQMGNASQSAEPTWQNYANSESTYVPTKMQIQLGLIPIVTRNDISNNFSLEKYATGELLKGNQRSSGGGIW